MILGKLLWLVSAAATIVTAQPSSRLGELGKIINDLHGQVANCSYQCFNSSAGTRTCDDVYQLITWDALSCLQSTCTTHEALESNRLLLAECGAPPRNVQGEIRGVSWALFIVTTIFVVGRLITRTSLFGAALMGPDDWAILVSYVVLIGIQAGVEIMVYFGMGTDTWTQDDTHIMIILILFYVAEFAYVIEAAVTKISILLLYLRIFPNQGLRKQIYGLMGIVIAVFLAFVIALFTYCKPFPYTWHRWDNEAVGTCDDINVQTYVHAGLNIVLDVAIIFIPVPHILRLDLSMKKRVGVTLIFVVGLFVTICSIVRLKYLVNWAFDPNPAMSYSNLAIWSVIELDVSVICACMPGMTALFRRLKQRGRDYVRSRSSANALSRTGKGAHEGNQSITKTTVISVRHTPGGTQDRATESELELVDRPTWANPTVPYSNGGEYADRPAWANPTVPYSNGGEYADRPAWVNPTAPQTNSGEYVERR